METAISNFSTETLLLFQMQSMVEREFQVMTSLRQSFNETSMELRKNYAAINAQLHIIQARIQTLESQDGAILSPGWIKGQRRPINIALRRNSTETKKQQSDELGSTNELSGSESLHRECLMEQLGPLVKDMDLYNTSIIDDLLEEDCLTQDEASTIKERPNRKDQIRKLIVLISKRSRAKFVKFLETLGRKHHYPYIANDIQRLYDSKMKDGRAPHCTICTIKRDVDIKDVVDKLCQHKIVDVDFLDLVVTHGNSSRDQSSLWEVVFSKIDQASDRRHHLNILQDALYVKYERLSAALGTCQITQFGSHVCNAAEFKAYNTKQKSFASSWRSYPDSTSTCSDQSTTSELKKSSGNLQKKKTPLKEGLPELRSQIISDHTVSSSSEEVTKPVAEAGATKSKIENAIESSDIVSSTTNEELSVTDIKLNSNIPKCIAWLKSVDDAAAYSERDETSFPSLGSLSNFKSASADEITEEESSSDGSDQVEADDNLRNKQYEASMNDDREEIKNDNSDIENQTTEIVMNGSVVRHQGSELSSIVEDTNAEVSNEQTRPKSESGNELGNKSSERKSSHASGDESSKIRRSGECGKVSSQRKSIGGPGNKSSQGNSSGECRNESSQHKNSGESGNESYLIKSNVGPGNESYLVKSNVGPGNESYLVKSNGGPGNESYLVKSNGGPGNESYLDKSRGESGNESYLDKSNDGPGNESYLDKSNGGPGNESYLDKSNGGPGNESYLDKSNGKYGNESYQGKNSGDSGNISSKIEIGESKNESLQRKVIAGPGNVSYKRTSSGDSGNETYLHTNSGDSGNESYLRTNSGDSGNVSYLRTNCGDSGNVSYKRTSSGDSGNVSYKRTSSGVSGNESYLRTNCGDSGNESYLRTSSGDSGNESYLRTSSGDSENESYLRTSSGDSVNESYLHTISGDSGNESYLRTSSGDSGNESYLRTNSCDSGNVSYKRTSSGDSANESSQIKNNGWPANESSQTNSSGERANESSQHKNSGGSGNESYLGKSNGGP